MRGTASDVDGTDSATINENTLSDSKIVIPTQAYAYTHPHVTSQRNTHTHMHTEEEIHTNTG